MRTTIFSTPILTPLLRIISVIILKLIGWKTRGMDLGKHRFVLIGAPHTSNWDVPLMLMVILKLRLRVFWMGKHTLFPPSLGWFMKWLGGIPVNRTSPHNIVNQTVCKYREYDELVMLIPPEGTRDKVKEWKTGFYHIANLAAVPILLGYVDAANKEAGFADFFNPTGEVEKDLQEIRSFYCEKKGLRAENS